MRYVDSSDHGPMALKLDMDKNGNKILRVRFPNESRGFSIQTNGNLPWTHRMTADSFDYKVAADELEDYISRYGTRGQRDATGFSLAKLNAKKAA